MKNFLLLLTLFYSFWSFGQTQDYAADLIPQELRNRASAIIRDENIVINMNGDNNFSETVTRSITILNNSGDNHASLLFYYNKGKKIGRIHGTIYDKSGQIIKKFGTKDFSDHSAVSQSSLYDDVRFKHYKPNIHNYPYTISYSYEAKHNQNMYIPYWQPNIFSDIAVQSSRYHIVCGAGHDLRIKEENIPNKVRIETTEKSKSYTWTAKNLSARKQEPFSPIQHRDRIAVKVAPTNFRFFKKRGEVENWGDLGKWVYDALLQDKHDLPEATKSKVHKLTAPYSTDREKAQALYSYMQQKTRYISIQVGIGGVEPFPASYVDRLGYGDCKALVNYMQALLAVINIESHYCIVEANNAKINLDPDFANIVDGNHVILCIPFENDTTWLECTNNKLPFGYLGSFTDDRTVLVCTAEGGKILRTPKLDPQTNLQWRKGQFTVEDDGSLTGAMQTSFSGVQLENRFGFASLSNSDLERRLKQAYDINNIFFNTVQYDTSAIMSKHRLTENIQLHIRHYAVKNGTDLFLQPNIFNHANVIPESKNRRNDIYINRGYTDIDEFEFHINDLLIDKIAPVKRTLECPMGKYELQVSTDGEKVRFYRKLQIIDGTYPSSYYESYFNFMREVSANDRGKYKLSLGI
jgi:hypothetical protein